MTKCIILLAVLMAWETISMTAGGHDQQHSVPESGERKTVKQYPVPDQQSGESEKLSQQRGEQSER